MNKSCVNFVMQLIDISPDFSVVYERVVNEWLPEDPPITTLFSALGNKMARDFSKESPENYKKWFSLIENGMSGEDEVLLVAVATGLLESLVTKAVELNIWSSINSSLGKQSRNHAEAWLS